MKKIFAVILLTCFSLLAKADTNTSPSVGDEQSENQEVLNSFEAQAIGFQSVNNDSFIRIIRHISTSPLSSSYWNAYRSNALLGIEQGNMIGDGPSAFIHLPPNTPITPGMISLSTDTFSSWMGQPSTNPDLHGNRIHIGLHIVQKNPFKPSQLKVTMKSSDAQNVFGFTADFSANNFGSSRIGIHYGLDGIKGTTDDVRYTAGTMNVSVNEFVYIGIANAFVAENAEDLKSIQQFVNDNHPLSITTTYTLGGMSQTDETFVWPTLISNPALEIARLTNFYVDWFNKRILFLLYGPARQYDITRSGTITKGDESLIFSISKQTDWDPLVILIPLPLPEEDISFFFARFR